MIGLPSPPSNRSRRWHGAATTAVLAVLLLIALVNWLTLRRPQSYPAGAAWPPVSILLPARDEALNVRACARSLLAQDYPDFELIFAVHDPGDAAVKAGALTVK